MFGYLDCYSGISGDKLLGAIVDAGVPLATIAEKLAALGVEGFSLRAKSVTRGGLAGTLVEVTTADDQPHRSLGDIEAILEGSKLEPAVRDCALETFRLLAQVEADVHGTDVANVHFHEVGALDAIVDIVGCAIGLTELGIDEMWASPVCTGFGTVETAHGTLPVPAPATARLLEGVPTYAGEVEGELTTPTGAALLRTFVSRVEPMPPTVVHATGSGAGSRQLDGISNLLRLRVGDRDETGRSAAGLEAVVVLETVIDHVTPEDLASALDVQREAGALDAWQVPAMMKKGRVGAAVTVLARPEDADRLAARLMADTGTLGVRRTTTERYAAKRHIEELESALGTVRVKVAEAAGITLARPEHDDVAAVAERTGLAIADVAARLATEAKESVREDAPAQPQPTE